MITVSIFIIEILKRTRKKGNKNGDSMNKEIESSNIVAIGGGTGLSTMLRGMKKYTSNLTAVVTVADNGGSSGILRKEFNMLPPGDIRNCILALAQTEPLLEKVFQYRFSEGSLAGQNFGNLFLAALNNIFGSFEQAVEKTSEVLAVKGKVLPVSMENIQLCAVYEDGTQMIGESEIVSTSKRLRKAIKEISLIPKNPEPYEKALHAIKQAELIILGPGSLYTSIIPNLLIKSIKEAIIESSAKVIYVSNIMTQPGETDGYQLGDHIAVIEKYLGTNQIDYVIINNETIPNTILDRYLDDEADIVKYNVNALIHKGIHIIEAPVLKIVPEKHLIRHNSEKLADIIVNLV